MVNEGANVFGAFGVIGSAAGSTNNAATVTGDGSLLGYAVAQQNSPGHAGYDDSHGYQFQLPNEFLDGVTTHVIQVSGPGGVFATQTGTLS